MEFSMNQVLQKGIEAHKAGNFKDAERYYESILRLQPNHPHANHNMGVLAVAVGRLKRSIPYFLCALDSDSSVAQFWLSYITVLIKLDKIDDARDILAKATRKGVKDDGLDQLERRLQEAHKESSKVRKEPTYASTNVLDSLKLEKALRHAKEQVKKGNQGAAERIYRDILIKFPNNKRANAELKGLFGNFVRKSPHSKVILKVELKKLVALYDTGQHALVVEQSQALAEKYPKVSFLWNLTGASAAQIGQFDKAILYFKRALAINPKSDQAYSNMGVALEKQGYLKEAIEAYRNALDIKPDNAEAYNNIGVTFEKQGKLEEAIEAYTTALNIKPDYLNALRNVGNAVKGAVFTRPHPKLQKTLTLLLDEKSFVRPSDIAHAAISLLKFEPALKRYLQNSSLVELGSNLPSVMKDLSKLPLLLKLMSVCPLPDLDLENLLRQLRASILYSISDHRGLPNETEFQSALALQCFINEYIHNQTEREDEALANLEAAVKETLSNGDQPSPQSLLCLASYKPLNRYEWSNTLLVNNEIEKVFIRQVLEPSQEAKFKIGIPVLGDITDKVSSAVRDQYEVNPYPRWINLGLPSTPSPISKVVEKLELRLFDDQIEGVPQPTILIAGCGTGQHSIETAARFKDSQVLAVDLSMSSLSYAKRKTEELGIQNIDYMQANVADLGKLGRQFHIIESVGVLHHMQDPLAGWRVLSDCLKPGGLMRIGLYSEFARQDIVEIRREIKAMGINPSNTALKSFRETVMISDAKQHRRILNFNDFYSMSEFKDLLFHVQEHRFSIPQIKDCLSELGLEFCGFEAAEIVSHFKLTNSGAKGIYDLDKWHIYEKANPQAFAGMYQFWCQKGH